MVIVIYFFGLLFIYNLFFDFISLFKNLIISLKTPKKKNKKEVNKQKRNVTSADVVVFAISIFLFYYFFILILKNNSIPMVFIVVILFLPTVSLHIINAINGSGTIKEIIVEKYSDVDLSYNEKLSFYLIISSFIFFCLYFDKISSKLIILPVNWYLIEIIISLFTLIFAFCLSFLALVLIILPIKHIQKICQYSSLFYIKFLKYRCDHFSIAFFEENFVIAKFTNRVLAFASQNNVVLRILFCVLLIPYAFLVDVFIGVFIVFAVYVLGWALVMFLELLKRLGKGVLFIVSKFNNIPEHKVVKNTFRASLIISVLVLVIFNRLSFIINFDESFLSITEFIASAVIIPVIFEWISSNKKIEAVLPEPNIQNNKSVIIRNNSTTKNNQKRKRYKRKK